MIQPNFLELDWRVRRAIELTQTRPDTLSSRSYAAKLQASLDNFRTMTDETDHTYTAWRMVRGEQMKAFRDLRLESDRVRALGDEHGLDDYPSQRIVYTDEAELLEFIGRAVAYLQVHVDEWDWISGAISRLEAGVSAAADLKRKEQAAYKRYTERAKDRAGSYDSLFGMLKDYIRDARSDVSSDPIYQEIRLVRA